jgi:hypothetical protein
MKTTAGLGMTTLLFGLMGFVGPCVRWLTWPPSAFEHRTSIALSRFVDDLVFLLWPTQSLAVMEVSTGSVVAGLVAVGANVALFAVVGVLAGLLFKGRIGLPLLYMLVVLSASLFALWGSGFSLAYLNIAALAVALLFYAVPFVLADRFGRKR